MTPTVGFDGTHVLIGGEGDEHPVAVLIVDDDPTKRLALKAVLAPLGYSLVEADSGRAALRCLLAQDFAVILLDVLMPGMNGFETAALIRQRRQSEMTPIIFVTAHAEDEMLDIDLYAAGAVDFIFAPVPPKELRAKVMVFANLFTRAQELATHAHQVQESADELRMLTDAAPIGIFQTDSDGRYVYTNPGWSEITGTSVNDAAGRKWESILVPEQRAELIADMADGPAGRIQVSRRFELRRPDSESRVVVVTSKPVFPRDGRVAGWVGTVADVTAEARAEAATAEARDRATEASQLKSDFLANMSHEIRTPMNGVIGMIELLLETQLGVRQVDYAQTARNSGEALLIIIEDILDFSRLEAGQLKIEHIDFNVGTVVRDVVDLLASSAQSKRIELIADIDCAIPAEVGGDPGRLRQILNNLVGNAIKFTEVGEIVIRVTRSEDSEANYVVRFEISDTGIGISDDRLDAIFQSFVQADTSTSRKYGGTGLGLTISAQLAALMGGVCGVTSRLGAGSTFWFSICVTPASGTSLRNGPVGYAELAGTTALVADGNATSRHVLSSMLRNLGIDPSSASSGPAAIAALRNARESGQPYAVALISQSMDGMDLPAVQAAIGAVARGHTHLIALTPPGHANQHVRRCLGDHRDCIVQASPSG